jgi:DHA2 family multidrug resistance protein
MYTAYFDTDVTLFIIGLSRLFFGCGIYFLITPLFSMSTQDITEEKLPSATGIFHFVRALSGGIGTSIFTTLWIRRTAYHHQIIGENLTPYSPMTTQYLDQLSDLGMKGQQGLAMLNNVLNDQSAILALNDCFWIMAWTFLALILFLPFGFKRRSAAEPIRT